MKQHREGEAAFDLLIRNGYDSMTAAHQRHLKNAISTTTGSDGGYMAPTTVSVAIADALNQYSSMRRMATVLLTSTGEMKHPSTDGRSEVGEQLAQNAASALQDISFSNTNLNTFKYGVEADHCAEGVAGG
jgi:HK97 family phage major capsid protein